MLQSGLFFEGEDETIVDGILERGGNVRAEVMKDRERANVQDVVREHVAPGSELSTGEWSAYSVCLPSMLTKSSIMSMPTLTGKSTRMDSKTSGVCWKRGSKATIGRELLEKPDAATVQGLQASPPESRETSRSVVFLARFLRAFFFT